MTLTDKVIEFLGKLPESDFRFDYYSWSRRNERGYNEGRINDYVRERCRAAMAPVEAKREVSRKLAQQRERELEKVIIAWAKHKDTITEGMRVKFKGTRDDGYRKVLKFERPSLQVIGYQFDYVRPWNKPEQKHTIRDSYATTTNHVSNIRQIMLPSGEWVKIRDYLKKNWDYYLKY